MTDDAPLEVSRYGPNAFKLLLELARVDYGLAEKSLFHFFKAAWSVLEPNVPFLPNWHQEIICEYLEASLAGDAKRLIINMPPRYLKSIIVTVMFPAWVWIRSPGMRFITASYAEDLATKLNVDRRLLIQSAWYQAAWASRFQFTADQNQKAEYTNTHRGHCVAVGMLGAVTGKGADFVIIDDPHNPKKAESEAERTAGCDAYDSTFTSRLDNKKTGRIIVVMQRLHEKDLTGHLLAKGEKWTQLKLPAEAPKKVAIRFPRSGKVIHREAGDILHPEREGKAELAAQKVSMGSYVYAGQYDQEPTPRAGGLLKKSYWRYFDLKAPRKFDRVIQSWDLTFKDVSTADPVAGFVLGVAGADIYVLDHDHGIMGLKKSCEAVRRMTKLWPAAGKKLIEAKANGPGLVDVLKSEIQGLVLEEVEGSKWERACLCEPLFEAGNIHLPFPEQAPWVEAVIGECAAFPKGAHDDRVDALTQGINHLRTKSLDRFAALGRR